MEKAEERPPALDSVRRGRAWTGWALLAVALVFAGDAGFWYLQLSQQASLAQARLERMVRAGAAGRTAAAHEIAAAKDTAQRLSLPWLDLLAALEASAAEEIALRGVEPDASTGRVTITAQAANYPAVLEYVRSLGRSEALSQVQLLRHEHKGRTIDFSVSAGWLGRRVQEQQ